MSIQTIKKEILPILKRQGVNKAAVFGSVARRQATKKSDIDFLIDFKKGKTLLDLAGLRIELEEKLGRKVDVVTYGGIHPLLRDRILNEQKIIYERKKRS